MLFLLINQKKNGSSNVQTAHEFPLWQHPLYHEFHLYSSIKFSTSAKHQNLFGDD